MTDQPEDLVALLGQLKDATLQHEEKRNLYEAARREESQALEKVNQLQKRFDVAVAQLKKGAFFQTTWASSSKGRGELA